jgi:hypothetical protein
VLFCIFTKRDGRHGPPARSKTKCNRANTRTKQGYATQSKAKQKTESPHTGCLISLLLLLCVLFYVWYVWTLVCAGVTHVIWQWLRALHMWLNKHECVEMVTLWLWLWSRRAQHKCRVSVEALQSFSYFTTPVTALPNLLCTADSKVGAPLAQTRAKSDWRAPGWRWQRGCSARSASGPPAQSHCRFDASWHVTVRPQPKPPH